MPRAVGRANGSNPVNAVLPCHRLIGANGSLPKYGCEPERKRAWDRARRPPASAAIPAGMAVADSGRVCDAL